MDIEKRLANALRESTSRETEPVTEAPRDLSARELLQMAWDRSEEELDQLRAELRILRQRHQAEERTLLARINEKKRLQRELLERVPEAGSA